VTVNNLTSNIDHLSNLFHYQNQEKTCNNVITKDPFTTQVSLFYLVKCQFLSQKATTENKTTYAATHLKKLTKGNNVFIVTVIV